ncbi:hypothetical protein [Roseicitreum antarcticum]|uniref:Uncharacterized protein n=1 Tax=Roseicitreum antarcticum TaxID=564137 RepID=A0A1H2WCS6_9RHOB|nr:hypothetical protein [Roseicitreum antarcticum]SDW78432.1 hypothetical protein SAMN04488238_103342 [Roseicitreum antarcticum]
MTQDISATEIAYNAARAGQARHTLVYIWGRNRETGQIESIGFWTGDDHQSFVIDGETRTYFGAGAAIDIDDITGGVGLAVRYVTARLAVVPEVAQAIRGYDPKLAPVEMHSAVFSLETNALVSEPRRIFKGEINEAPTPTPAIGGEAVFEIRCASSARALTRTLALKRSDAELRRRNPNDRFREYVSTSGIREVPWGEQPTRGAGG